jgi:hypothetical protein
MAFRREKMKALPERKESGKRKSESIDGPACSKMNQVHGKGEKEWQ